MSDIPDLVAQTRAGSTRALGRLISFVEDGNSAVPQLMSLIADATGRAHVIGLTGPPGAGKSTLTAALVAHYRGLGRRVAVLAVDPSSAFSGGALLGDRIRMQQHAIDPGVFIRSMASRGHLGGLAAATPQAVRVLEVAGFETVIIETVGVGQSEIEVASATDTVCVALAPGMGDGIQAAKAGVLEIADVFVVNKADRDGVEATTRELRHLVSMTGPSAGWTVPVQRTVATTGDGVPALAEQIDAHLTHLRDSGALTARRRDRARAEISALVISAWRASLAVGPVSQQLSALADAVAAGDKDAFSAASELIDRD